MTITEAIDLIKTFREFDQNLFGDAALLDKIQDEYGAIPQNIVEYINQIIPNSNNIYLDLTGDPFCLFSAKDLLQKRDEFAYDFELESSSWINKWLIIGLQLNDPFCFSLAKNQTQIFRFYFNGVSGLSSPVPVANSIGQFLLCAYAIDHAINKFEKSIIIDEDSFDIQLAPEPSKWLFPRMREWAAEYYEEWCEVFENCNEEY